MTKSFTSEEISKFCTLHSEAERVGLAETMATVADDPVWEMHSMGLRIAGRDAVEEFYRRVLDPMVDKTRGIELRHIAYGDKFQVTECFYEIALDDGNTAISPGVVYLEVAEDGRIKSERFYVYGAMADGFCTALGSSFANVPGVEMSWARGSLPESESEAEG